MRDVLVQYGFYFDQTRCTGCCTCIVACKDWHDIPAGPANWLRIETVEKGNYPAVFVAYMIIPCFHCANPACVAVCPVQAISKNVDNGIVVVNHEACMGKDECGKCLTACPYHAPQFASGHNNPAMQKCDMCLERVQEGKKPVCVAACPMRALDVGPLEELRSIYTGVENAAGFHYNDKIKPSIIFKPRKEKGDAAAQGAFND